MLLNFNYEKGYLDGRAGNSALVVGPLEEQVKYMQGYRDGMVSKTLSKALTNTDQKSINRMNDKVRAFPS